MAEWAAALPELLHEPVWQYTLAGVVLVIVLLVAIVVRDEINAASLGMKGPPRWPIVGNIPDLLTEPWTKFYEFYQKYGHIYQL